jgi:hypothetical protein
MTMTMTMTRSTNEDSGQRQRQMTTTDNDDGQRRGEPSKRRMMDNEVGVDDFAFEEGG